MISLKSMKEEFGSAVRLTPTTFKATLELRNASTHYYFRSVRGAAPDLLTTRSDGDDSNFPLLFLEHVATWIQQGGSLPAKIEMPIANPYQFDAAFVLPSSYHGHLKGVLDDKHATLVNCVPIHMCEFTGRETSAEYRLWQTRVGVERWNRNAFPYIAMEFENPKGGHSSPMERISLDSCISNLESLTGGANGHAKLANYAGATLTIKPKKGGNYQIVSIDGKIDCKSSGLPGLVREFASSKKSC